MRAIKRDLDNVKQAMTSLQGRRLILEVNRGRNKIERVEGVVDKLYPSIFTVLIDGKPQSYSYNDILSRSVRFYNAK